MAVDRKMEPDSYPTQSFAILAVPTSLGAKIMEIGEKILGRLKPLGKFAEQLGKNYHDVILGLDIISNFDLLISTKRNLVELTYVGT